MCLWDVLKLSQLRRECATEKHLNLALCKFCDEHNVLNLESVWTFINSLTSKIKTWFGKKPPFNLHSVKLHGTMNWMNYEWSHFQWTLLIISVCKRLKLQNIKIIMPCYKFIRVSGEKESKHFVAGIQREFDKLRKKRNIKKRLITKKWRLKLMKLFIATLCCILISNQTMCSIQCAEIEAFRISINRRNCNQR